MNHTVLLYLYILSEMDTSLAMPYRLVRGGIWRLMEGKRAISLSHLRLQVDPDNIRQRRMLLLWSLY